MQARNAGAGQQLGGALRLAPGELDNVVVTTSSGVHAGPLAEFALFGLLAFAKGLPTLLADQRARHWPPGQQPVGELRDRTLLIVGLGEIGTETARLAQAFGMRVLAVNATRRARPRTSTSSTRRTSCPRWSAAPTASSSRCR